MEDLTDVDLDRMLALAEATHAGRWVASIEGRDHVSCDSVILTSVGTATRGPDLWITADGVKADDAIWDFIAASRYDVPRLIAEVRRLRRQAERR